MATSGDKWRQVAASGSWWRGLIAAMAMMFVANTATAQNNPLPWDNLTEPAAYVTFGVDDSGWTLYPVITANNDFIGFFGYLPDSFVIGNNVSLLWLIPDNGDGTWSMYGWSNTDLKVVSDYLDNLTGTLNVLGDTGLDIFSGPSQPIVPPKSMPNGIAVGDPAAPIVAATHDPVIAGALIAAGAAGAPNLTQAVNLQPIDQCIASNAGNNFSQLDIDLAYKSRIIQEEMVVWLSVEILDSLGLTGLDAAESILRSCNCTAMDHENWGPWSAWVCGAGPFTNSNGTTCTYSSCSRSRSGWHVVITRVGCRFSRTAITETDTRVSLVIPTPASGVCPSSP